MSTGTKTGEGSTLDHWGRGISLRFIEDGGSIGPGTVVRIIGMNHRVAQVGTLVLMAVIFALGFRRLRRIGGAALLPVAALCSVCGMLGFYHRHYDDVMLFPVLIAALQIAAVTRRPLAITAAVVTLASVMIHKRFFVDSPWHAVTQAAVWVAASATVLWGMSQLGPTRQDRSVPAGA